MRHNWYRNTLLIIALVGVVVGIVLLAVGGNPPQPDLEFGAIDPLAGVPFLVWGGAITNLAIFSFFLWLHASAISWAAEHPSPPRGSDGDDA
jgi:hypothetical protein